MFERSLVESRVKHASSRERWTGLVSVAVQVSVAAVVIGLPLLHPERLRLGVDAPRVVLPLVRMEPPKVERSAEHAGGAAMPVLATTVPVVRMDAPRRIAVGLVPTDPGPVPTAGPVRMSGIGVGDGIGRGLGIGDWGWDWEGVRQEPRTVKVSSGVSTGLLLDPIRPVYPAIARAAGVQGTVVVEAVISKAGWIESVRAVSGPEMLRGAAVEAIRVARYRPFLLNGEATAVETTITVNFKMGG
jgi:protein TonB